MNISSDIDLLRFSSINSYYAAAVLKSRIGQHQILRLCSGVSGLVHISIAKLKTIGIPVAPDAVQQQVEARYRHMTTVHEAAMTAREAGDDNGYRSKLAYAEQLLDELIAYVEQVIEAGPGEASAPAEGDGHE